MCEESVFDIYSQSEDMADFHILQGKMEPPPQVVLCSIRYNSKVITFCSSKSVVISIYHVYTTYGHM